MNATLGSLSSTLLLSCPCPPISSSSKDRLLALPRQRRPQGARAEEEEEEGDTGMAGGGYLFLEEKEDGRSLGIDPNSTARAFKKMRFKCISFARKQLEEWKNGVDSISSSLAASLASRPPGGWVDRPASSTLAASYPASFGVVIFPKHLERATVKDPNERVV